MARHKIAEGDLQLTGETLSQGACDIAKAGKPVDKLIVTLVCNFIAAGSL